ncbi:MAG: hypothetical protein ABS76_22750 [Pelagibacterium sp. SCN 64-44]|nr:MAG: hypothetical protein ABS76_22750 [Pelagibacterium sp. SCN 64-44]
MADRQGLLLVLVDPAPERREELNAWYDTEHLPERRELPGFLSAQRFEAVGQGPLYAALYDLEDLSALDSAGYRAVSGENFSPWTRRVTRISPTTRIVAEQIHPGGAVIGPCSHLLLLLLRFGAGAAGRAGRIEGALRAHFARHANARIRLFQADEPAPGSLVVTVEFSGAEAPDLPHSAIFGAEGEGMELMALYRPYKSADT